MNSKRDSPPISRTTTIANLQVEQETNYVNSFSAVMANRPAGLLPRLRIEFRCRARQVRRVPALQEGKSALDHCVGRVIVYGFKVFGHDTKTLHARDGLQLNRYISHQIFDKLGVFVCAFGHVLFIGTFEQTP